MKKIHFLIFALFLIAACVNHEAARQEISAVENNGIAGEEKVSSSRTELFTRYVVDPGKQHLRLFRKNNRGEIYGSIQKLKDDLDSEEKKMLLFAMNGGMYLEDQSPQGLFIENSKVIRPLNKRSSDDGNFFMKPNGVFYLDKHKKAGVITLDRFNIVKNVQWATQSGPMLVIGGAIHPGFPKTSISEMAWVYCRTERSYL